MAPIRPPYRRYVYSTTLDEQQPAENTDHEPQRVTDNFGNWKDFSVQTNSNIRSVYVLSANAQVARGPRWPRLQFQKVDVLQCCLHGPPALAEVPGHSPAGPGTGLGAEPPLWPPELVAHIYSYLAAEGLLRPRHLLVSHMAYALGVALLYHRPILRGDNFFKFVEAVQGLPRLGTYICELDLSFVNQSGKNAFVAKLLRRSRPSLRRFTAPQTSFGLAPLMAVRQCLQLESLDLSLVSETLDLQELFALIRQLQNLTSLAFPRLLVEIADYSLVVWPPRLESLRVAGGISDDFLINMPFPKTIRHMELAHCPKVSSMGFEQLLFDHGRRLLSLSVQFPMPGLTGASLDIVFVLCPNLLSLAVSVDYLLAAFFDNSLPILHCDRRLELLHIDSSGMLGTADRVDPVDLAVVLEDKLQRLKTVRCTAKLGWNPNDDVVMHIASVLEERGGGLYIGY